MRYTRKVKEETKRAYLGSEYDSPLKDIVQKWTFNNNPYLAGYYGQQSQLSYGQQNQLNYGQQNQLNYGHPVDIAMRQTEHFSKTPWNPDTHILIYETETEEMFFAYILDEGKWKALVKKNISRRNNNLRGGVNNVQVIKDKGIPVCKNITFISAKPFRREDKPGKKYYEIKFVTAKGENNTIIEKKEFDSNNLCRIAEGIVEEGQEKLCSCLFRIMINQLLEDEFEITIPMYAGWYKDDVYGWVYLDKLEYPSLPDNAISTGMRKRIIDPTGFNKDDFLSTLITTIKEYNPKRLVVIFGAGGNRDRNRRFEMGEVCSKLADFLVLTNDNPRFEEPQAIIDDIIVGVKKGDAEYVSIPDRAKAIRYAIENAKDGDVILLIGKGHEDYIEIKGQRTHFDEREVIKEIIGSQA